MIVNSQRPGVFSDYSVSSIYASSNSSKFAAVVAKSSMGEKLKVVEIVSYMQAFTEFGADIDNATMLTTVRLLLENGVTKIYCVPVEIGITVPTVNDYSAAFDLIKNTANIGVVLSDSQDPDVLLCLKASLLESSAMQHERIGICGIDTIEQAVSSAGLVNSERMIVCSPACTINNRAHGIFSAAAFTAAILNMEDSSYNLNGCTLNGVSGLEYSLSNLQVETLLNAGVAALEVVGGQVEVIKAISSYTNMDGIPDKTYQSINTILIIDSVITSIRDSLKKLLKGAKSNEATRESISSQVIIELSSKQDRGIINNYARPKVYTSPSDPSICIVEIFFEVAHVVNQIHISTKIQV